MSLHDDMQALGDRAVDAAAQLAQLDTAAKNAVLKSMANAIESGGDSLKEANRRDLEAGEQAGLGAALLDRLELTDSRIAAMADGLRQIAALPDPVGEELSRGQRPNGLDIQKIRVPIGVIGIIYESRPNVTVDAAGLCLKAANAVILRGGKEAIHSNARLADILRDSGGAAGLPADAVQLVRTTDRDAVREMVQMEGKVDLIIPRGGEALIRAVTELARVPVLKHYNGICHVYVDASADRDMALDIVENAKCQRPGVCNALETLVVDERIAADFLPAAVQRLTAQGVECRGDEAARRIAPDVRPASDEDWSTEYLDLILSIRVAPGVDAAIDHINTYGSHHSDAIVAADADAQERFTRRVQSAAVLVNASTRFVDGFEFGMGAEIGISTDKLHARGPVGLEELTTYKYVVRGTGQVRG